MSVTPSKPSTSAAFPLLADPAELAPQAQAPTEAIHASDNSAVVSFLPAQQPVNSPRGSERSQSTDDGPTSIMGIDGEIPASELGDSPQDDNPALLASLVYLVPFPPPVNAYRSKKTTPFFIYTPPRSDYLKPAKNEDGKRPKDKLPKRISRRVQKEIRMGEQIKRNEFPLSKRFSRIQKIKGSCIRGLTTVSKWMPTPCVETLARLPPKRKLGEILVIYPENSGEPLPDGCDQPYQPTEDEIRHDLEVLLRRTKKRVIFRLVAISMALPIALGIEAFAPVFTTEMSLAYLAFQVYGYRKLKSLLEAPKKAKKTKAKKQKKGIFTSRKAIEETGTGAELAGLTEHSTLLRDSTPEAFSPTACFKPQVGDQAIFDPMAELLYKICSRIDPFTFPPVESQKEEARVISQGAPTGTSDTAAGPSSLSQGSGAKTVRKPTLHKPEPEVVKALLENFRTSLPEEVLKRHNLDDERVSQDLARYMKKAATEYVDSLKGRPDRGPHRVTRKWFLKRSTVRQERKEKRKINKIIKAEEREQSQNEATEAARLGPLDSVTAPSEELNTEEGSPSVRTNEVTEQKPNRNLILSMLFKGKSKAPQTSFEVAEPVGIAS